MRRALPFAAIPGSAVAVHTLLGHVPPEIASAVLQAVASHPHLSFSVGTSAGAGGALYLCRRRIRERIAAPSLHQKQDEARRRFPFYPELIRDHLRLLGITPAEFRKRVPAKRSVASYLLQNPALIPRPELLSDIARALFVSEAWLSDGGDYGDEAVEDRLIWYHERRLAFGYTRKQVLDGGEAARDLLKAVEHQRREELGMLPAGGQNG